MAISLQVLGRFVGTDCLADALEYKRQEMIRQYYAKMFLLGGMITGTDTYKRTMGKACQHFAMAPSAYHLTFRKAMAEPGADDQLVMAGHEAMLAQWFNKPLKRRDIILAAYFANTSSKVKAFPDELWQAVLGLNRNGKTGKDSEDVYLPIDIWGFPGGQTFLKGVPSLSVEGMGGLVSYIEPAMCRYFAPVQQATKARLMAQVTDRDAEFGLRAAPDELCNITLLLARYVGSGGRAQLTSNDTAEFMWPHMFKAIGTIGHEFMCSNQALDRGLSECELEMMNRALKALPDAKLLTDLVDAETIGLENAIAALKANPKATAAGARIDSGDIKMQTVLYHNRFRQAGITPDRITVFEDEVSPQATKEVYDHFRAETGEEPNKLFPGAGGYWWRGVHRDTLSAAFKRSWTDGNPNIKFSNSPGKESIPGKVRVYERGDVLYVADASETVDGKALYKKLVSKGRIVYKESFQVQAKRSDATWGKYKKVELSPLIHYIIESFRLKRDSERRAARARLNKKPAA